MVSASDLGPEGREFEPWPVRRQNTVPLSNLVCKWEPANCLTKCWEVTCDGLLFYPEGSRNTLSRFILQKLEICAGTDEPSGSPNYDWGQT